MESEAANPFEGDSTAQQLKRNVDDIHSRLREDALEIFRRKFPAKIIKLDDMMRGDLFEPAQRSVVSRVIEVQLTEAVREDAHADADGPAAKKRKVAAHGETTPLSEVTGRLAAKMRDAAASENPWIPINPELIKLFETLKSEVLELVRMVSTVKIWVQLSIPRVEDGGNNFGIQIQEDTVGELTRVEDTAFGLLDQISKYHISRGKLVSKIAKYPHIEDWIESVKQLDEKEYFNTRLCFLDLRNGYLSLYDLLQKNFDKIQKPRSSAVPTMY